MTHWSLVWCLATANSKATAHWCLVWCLPTANSTATANGPWSLVSLLSSQSSQLSLFLSLKV